MVGTNYPNFFDPIPHLQPQYTLLGAVHTLPPPPNSPPLRSLDTNTQIST